MAREDLNLRMLDLARFHIGVLEAGGANRGPMVERFQQAVDGKASGEPWCMAFMQYLIKHVVEVHGGRPQVFASEHCMTVWEKSPPGVKNVLPQVGYLVIWRHGNGPAGHVGIVSEIQSDHIVTVEGNTGPGVGVIREGDGVYLRKRSRWGEGTMSIVGYLKVF